jgi:hypothetical protein
MAFDVVRDRTSCTRSAVRGLVHPLSYAAWAHGSTPKNASKIEDFGVGLAAPGG